MRLHTWLTLGRASNLPSVWSNVFAAALIAQASLGNEALSTGAMDNEEWIPGSVSLQIILWTGCLLSLSLMYLAGMFLNDAFDANWDRHNNNARPITQGKVSATAVWLNGLAMLALGIGLAGSVYQRAVPEQATYGWVAVGLLAALILLYNRVHKQFRHSAVLMGGCRLGVYLVAALMLADITPELFLAALALCLYISGITYVAREEHTNKVSQIGSVGLLFLPVILVSFLGYTFPYFWLYACCLSLYLLYTMQRCLFTPHKNVRGFIGGLLAAVPLLDGLMLASMNLILPSLLCVAVFFIMPGLQKWIQAT
ncbi:UbiA family prenyltransferase [Photobacterium halotolerans]|uniref:UbiA family prenyltransferase n=1 Tax=Photobacterium halotolerans TaxID=265726 RepID=UPI0003F5DE10|nr:UbiA family prenyltransferase [Photobacterium halotolerans]